MSGFELFDGDTKMRITNGARTVFTTDGTLINLLPASAGYNNTFNFVYPDIVKDFQYNWRHNFDRGGGGLVGYDSYCACWLTACPQEFEQELDLVAVPQGADVFVGKVMLTRVAGPSHTWNGITIEPKQVMGAWVPFISGSLIIEAEVGIARACSIFISGGMLKFNWEHSVCTPPGGWGQYGSAYHWISNPNSGGGGENVYGSKPGLSILQVSGVNVPSFAVSSGAGAPYYDERTRYGVGAAQCPLPNYAAYDYSSTYQITVVGSFGRRS